MARLFWRIYVQPISAVLWEMALLLILWALIGGIAKNSPLWKWFNGVVFLGIIGAILYTTVFHRSANPQNPSLIPFYTFVEAKIQPELYRAMLMNVFLFEPIGLSLPHILPKKVHPVAVTILFAMLFSIGIEAAQLFFQLGRCEIDDVLMNTLGAITGAAAYDWRIRKVCV